MRARICAGGREVELDLARADITPDDLVAQALTLWRLIEGSGPGQAPTFGLGMCADIALSDTRDGPR